MLKRACVAVSLAALAMSPALAQSTDQKVKSQTPAASTTAPQTQSSETFMQSQTSNEWRSSKLVGAQVTGANNENIGEIDDVLLDGSGMAKSVVIGVGGFLGMGEKDVAIPFSALKIVRKSGDDAIDKITVSYTKEQLKDAPDFRYLAEADSSGSARQSTGSGSTTNNAR
jgi:sporulation protein YlmC with PRC-barrel domain